MKITDLELNGAKLIEMAPYIDERGSFMRQFCVNELKNAGIEFNIKQCNISTNNFAGTVRGMHYQLGEYPENKIVTCISGKIYDVLVDIRKDSPTYMKWIGTELSEKNYKILYIAAGIAHGFCTLEDNSTVYYQLDEFFHSECYDGIRWNDPKIGIKWPKFDEYIINNRDQSYKLI